ncbi:hypothetical protein [Paludisphaera soli]|uniref:hypothetical protein n=1 Tax=Paludisphaera soli TaxID=2712865 RepID=UPI0013EC356B|nr:hypothetical protein [Paludisphaera soli]
MIAQLSAWLLTVTLAQAPTEPAPAWLKVVPGDIDVVVRSRGIESTSRDLTDMLRAMSPRAAETAVPALTQLLDQFRGQLGEDAAKTPWAALIRAVPPGPDGVLPFAVLVMEDDSKAVLKALGSGKEPALRPQDGGVDEFDDPHGEGSWYAFDGAGFTAVGPDRSLVAAVASPAEKAFDATLTPGLAGPFLSGDVGLYVNVARLATRYADQIAQGRQTFMAALDQAAQASPNPGSMDFVKNLYGGLFDSLGDAEALTLGLDFAAEGLRLAGRLDLKAAADSAQPADDDGATLADLGRLPADAGFYVFMNMQASTIQKWQAMSLSMMNPGGKLDPATARALEGFEKLGRLETLGTMTFDGGLRGFNVIKTSDPKAYIAATEAMLTGMKGSDGPLNVYKDVKIERDVQEHRGIRFTHIVATFDEEKLAKLAAGNPQGSASLKAMMGGDALGYWIGTDDRRVIQATTPDWDRARAQIDQFLDGGKSVGDQPAFQAVRSALADRASFLMILSAQGLVRMMATQLAATANKPELKDLADLPSEPAYFGLSLTPAAPNGYEFRLSVPSPVVPVFEKGMLPVLQNLQGQAPR